MPECAIGLFPDIGAAHFLSKLPGALGMWMALTGSRLSGRAVRAAGLATHYIPSQQLSAVEAALCELGVDKLRSFQCVAHTLDACQLAHAAAGLEPSTAPPDGASVL
jgi:enoyl-CoA hydratase/carnithine racemase